MKKSVLMLCVLATLARCGWADSAWNVNVRAAQVDLDGDGRRENIRLVRFKTRASGSNFWQTGAYRLMVNDQVIFDNAVDPSGAGVDGFYIADINRRDRFKEIVVSTEQAGGYYGAQIFAYIGKKLRRVHRKMLRDAEFKGNGIVTETNWNGFWASKETYRLNARHTLTYLPQKFHRVGIKTKLDKALALHPYRQINDVTRVLRFATKVEITRSDLSWYEIRAPHGTRGWITERELLAHMSENIHLAG